VRAWALVWERVSLPVWGVLPSPIFSVVPAPDKCLHVPAVVKGPGSEIVLPHALHPESGIGRARVLVKEGQELEIVR
jgi:hypothetical protein